MMFIEYYNLIFRVENVCLLFIKQVETTYGTVYRGFNCFINHTIRILE